MSEATKTIVLTGASRGLGLAMLEGFLERGHAVAACARSQISATSKNANPKLFASIDVTNAREVDEWAKSILGEIGAPDLLINNAALINRSAALGTHAGRIRSGDRREHQRRLQCDTRVCACDDPERTRGDREFQFRLGTFDFAGSGTVLRNEVGNRRTHSGARTGTSIGHGSGAAESRCD